MASDEASDALAAICFPYAVSRQQAFQRSGRKFAHYTSAANALNILRGQTIWLRNASLMNDFSEISHGFRCLAEAVRQLNFNNRLLAALEPIHRASRPRSGRSWSRRRRRHGFTPT